VRKVRLSSFATKSSSARCSKFECFVNKKSKGLVIFVFQTRNDTTRHDTTRHDTIWYDRKPGVTVTLKTKRTLKTKSYKGYDKQRQCRRERDKDGYQDKNNRDKNRESETKTKRDNDPTPNPNPNPNKDKDTTNRDINRER
jgi:hypothetical protein